MTRIKFVETFDNLTIDSESQICPILKIVVEISRGKNQLMYLNFEQ